MTVHIPFLREHLRKFAQHLRTLSGDELRKLGVSNPRPGKTGVITLLEIVSSAFAESASEHLRHREKIRDISKSFENFLHGAIDAPSSVAMRYQIEKCHQFLLHNDKSYMEKVVFRELVDGVSEALGEGAFGMDTHNISHENAIKFFIAGSERGNLQAKFALGVLNEVGAATSANTLRARQWYYQSATAGNPVALKKVDELEKLALHEKNTEKSPAGLAPDNFHNEKAEASSGVEKKFLVDAHPNPVVVLEEFRRFKEIQKLMDEGKGLTKKGKPRKYKPPRQKEEIEADPYGDKSRDHVKLGARVSLEIRDQFLSRAKELHLTQGDALEVAIRLFNSVAAKAENKKELESLIDEVLREAQKTSTNIPSHPSRH